MSDEAVPSSDAPVKKKKKSKLVLILAVIILLGAAGGGGYFFLHRNAAKAKAAGLKGKKNESARAESDDSQSDDDASDKGKDAGDKSKKAKESSKADSLASLLPEDEEVKQVIEIPAFTLNLADPEESRFLRLSMSVGIAEESGEKPNQVFLTRVRNAVLTVLMTKTSTEILSVNGKSALRKELLEAIRAAAKEPPVQAVYITELIVQR